MAGLSADTRCMSAAKVNPKPMLVLVGAIGQFRSQELPEEVWAAWHSSKRPTTTHD